MVKKGDTLIEVLLAVGIFSMIAISVVAVMSGGTSSAQNALETTLAREEIDAQAEALRYVHDSYINDKNSDNTNLPTVALWRQIVNPDSVYRPGDNDGDNEAVLQYNPSSCPTHIGENEALRDYAFILDTRNLDATPIDNESPAYISAKEDLNRSQNSQVFSQTLTYPRLVFGTDNEENLIEDSTSKALRKAEGIYIIAVADKDTTTVLDIDGNPVQTGNPAFFDFYIRTCWYGTDAETPSSISTVIRLHNPDVTTTAQIFSYCIDGGSCGKDRIISRTQKDVPLDKEWPRGKQNPEHKGWTFDGWCIGTATGTRFEDGAGVYDYHCDGKIIPPGGGTYVTELQDQNVTVTRLFTHIKYYIKYNPNGGTISTTQQVCYEDEPCIIMGESPKLEGKQFRGWCTNSVDLNTACDGVSYQSGSTFPIIHGTTAKTTNLYAAWEMHPDTVFLVDSSGSMSSMIYASKAAIKMLTMQTKVLNGKVALFNYDSSIPNQAKMLCGFQEGNGTGQCTTDNIEAYVDDIKVYIWNENLPEALYTVTNTLKGQWSPGYTKTIVIITDEPIYGGYGNLDLTRFINAVKTQSADLTPLGIYIVTTSSYLNIYKSDFNNKFSGYNVTVNTIEMPSSYKNCSQSLTNANCLNAVNSVVNNLKNVIK